MANDFSGDSACKALYRMESGALITDSIGGNTLTPVNAPGTDTTNHMEGSAAASFVAANEEYFKITDAALDSGFPLKSGDTNKKITLVVKMYLASLPSSSTMRTLWSKYDGAGSKKSLMFGAYNDGSDTSIRLYLGYNGGASTEPPKDHASALSTTTKYCVAISFDNSDYSYAIRIRALPSGSVVGTDLTGTATLDGSGLSVDDALMQIGSFNPSHTWGMDGLEDELVVFDDIKTASDITDIAKEIYGAAGGISIPVAMHHHRQIQGVR